MGFAEAVIAFIVIGIPTIAIFGIVSRVYRHREKRLELEAQIAAAQAPAPDIRGSSRSGFACWNGSSPTRGTASPMRSSGCATNG